MIGSPRTLVKKQVRQQLSVPAAAVAKTREPLLAAQIQAEASVAGALAAQQHNLQNAGACLLPIRFSDSPNGLNGLAADLSNLFDSFQTLAGDPANLPLRRSVVRSAQEVAAQFNRASSRLNALKFDLNASIQKDVLRANQGLNDIAGLNRRIMEAQAAVRAAGLLTGQREQHLEALSGCVNITVAPRPDAGVNVSIDGVTMVSGAETSDNLATYPDKNGNLRIQAPNTGMRLKLAGGSIAGKIAARDGGLADLQNGLDTLASQLIARVNSIYNSGCDLDGGTGRDFFTGGDASDIGVNNIVADDPSQLRAGAAALALAKLGGRNVSDLGNQTFSQSYAQTVSELDNTLSSVNDDLSSSQAVTQMLANERGAAHGLSLNDARAELTRYEQASAISAGMITTLDEMFPMQ
jgi:flagellar hook-associated protein 1 FlgK